MSSLRAVILRLLFRFFILIYLRLLQDAMKEANEHVDVSLGKRPLTFLEQGSPLQDYVPLQRAASDPY